MYNLELLEQCFQKFSKNLDEFLPEDIFEVDLATLHKLDLMHYDDPKSQDPKLTQYFHVIESLDKITLINEEFVVWIVPEVIDEDSRTYTIVARNQEKEPHLELAYITSGVFNNSKLILRVLEKLLHEIHENEKFLNDLE